MRLVSRYIIKELILPFIYSLMVIVLMLFINFFLRAIDRFLGKGLDIFTILEYLFLNLCTYFKQVSSQVAPSKWVQ